MVFRAAFIVLVAKKEMPVGVLIPLWQLIVLIVIPVYEFVLEAPRKNDKREER